MTKERLRNLVLSRKAKEAVAIMVCGKEIIVEVDKCSASTVRLRFLAPASVPIRRRELPRKNAYESAALVDLSVGQRRIKPPAVA